ncbi:hypothetical protein FA95DRAFT_1578935, partial [Auriscalpium vulgare]
GRSGRAEGDVGEQQGNELTNYLDRDSLAALIEGLKVFEGGVLVNSHNRLFPLAVPGGPTRPWRSSPSAAAIVQDGQEDIKGRLPRRGKRAARAGRQGDERAELGMAIEHGVPDRAP